MVGSLGQYLLKEELDDLMASIVAEYREKVVYDIEIGKSYEGRPIMAYAFMLGTTKEFSEHELQARRSVFINGVHHARELTTISQVVYSMLTYLHAYEHGLTELTEVMDQAALIFVPTVNVDGFTFISDTYKATKRFEYYSNLLVAL